MDCEQCNSPATAFLIAVNGRTGKYDYRSDWALVLVAGGRHRNRVQLWVCMPASLCTASPLLDRSLHSGCGYCMTVHSVADV